MYLIVSCRWIYLRDKVSQAHYCSLLESDPRGLAGYSTTYGVNNRSILTELPVTKCLPFDVMHTVFEGILLQYNIFLVLAVYSIGVVPHVISQVLYHVITECGYLTLDKLNLMLKAHMYGYCEMVTKPNPIFRDNGGHYHLKQKGFFAKY